MRYVYSTKGEMNHFTGNIFMNRFLANQYWIYEMKSLRVTLLNPELFPNGFW